jgi:predicted transcriptional regulator
MEEAERLQSQLESERKMALQPLKQPTVQYTQPHNFSAEAVARVIDNAESERDTEETAHVLQEERSTAPDPPTLPDGDASYRSSQSQAGSTQGDSENAALRAVAHGCPCPPLLGLTDKLLDKIGKMLDTEISPFTSNQWAQTMGCNFVEGRNECREMFLLGLADRVPKNNVFLYTFNFSRADYTTAYQEISGGRIIEPVTKKQWNHALSILEQAGIEYIDKTVAFIRECVELGKTTFFLTDLCQYGSVQDKHCSVAVQTLVDRGIIVLPKKKNMKHRIVVPMTESDTDRELLQADVACQERESQSIMVKLSEMKQSGDVSYQRIAQGVTDLLNKGKSRFTSGDWIAVTGVSRNQFRFDMQTALSLGLISRDGSISGGKYIVYKIEKELIDSNRWENISVANYQVLNSIVRVFGSSPFTKGEIAKASGIDPANIAYNLKALKRVGVISMLCGDSKGYRYHLCVPIEEAISELRVRGFAQVALVG